MSLIKIGPDDQENFTVTTNPIRTYKSSSLGVTGSVYVFARRSDIEKNIAPSKAFFDPKHDDVDINTELSNLYQAAISSITKSKQTGQPGNFAKSMIHYLDKKVNQQNISSGKHKAINVERITPSVTFSKDTMKKLYVKDVLMRHYRVSYPTSSWDYPNYHSINFFTSSNTSNNAVLLYANYPQNHGNNLISGRYVVPKQFSFDFNINARYNKNLPNGHFKAGTIFHLSSTYALSLVTGSAKDQNGNPTGYRIQLQLSHSADISPSKAKPGVYPNDLIFLSDDNSIKWNHWHRVVVRWGTYEINQGIGSFNIDGIDRGIFEIPSATIAPKVFNASANPDVLCVGNYYEGRNVSTSEQKYFFSRNSASREGLKELTSLTSPEKPANYNFTHPLNAELHDLMIRREYMSDAKIASSVNDKFTNKTGYKNNIIFYLPPFFSETSPLRKPVLGTGGVLHSPSLQVIGTTNTPVNVPLAYNVNGHYINIENFLYDYALGEWPLLHDMSGTKSTISAGNFAKLADYFIYEDVESNSVKRNLLIMPCDDGNYKPNWELSGLPPSPLAGSATQRFVYEKINLNDFVSDKSLQFQSFFPDDSSNPGGAPFIPLIGLSPFPGGCSQPPGPSYAFYTNLINSENNLGKYLGNSKQYNSVAPYTIYQYTRDGSSNQVTIFNISNFFYGKRILPGSFVITDSNITGSLGAMKITLRDDGEGGLYRANSFTTHAKWNSVGNIFYEEGIVIIKNPHLYFFGKDQYEMSFKGEQNLHTLKVDVLAPRNQINSSSNPNFMPLSASGYIADPDPNYVYVTGINFHDKDLNVVAKTQLTQPILKRHGDKVMFKISMDFLWRAEKKEDDITKVYIFHRLQVNAIIEADGRKNI